MLAVALLSGAGMISLLSSQREMLYKQISWFGISILVALILAVLDLRSFFSHKAILRWLYLFICGLLGFAYLFAPSIKGNRSWIFLGSFQIQPSEFAKVILILILAYFFSKAHIGIGRWSIVLKSFLYFVPLGLLIAALPDMGSAMVLFCLWFGLVLVSGMPIKKIIISFLIGLVALVVVWVFILKPYQKDRVMGAIFPERDPMGVNYHVIQSKIAIGSGGIFGKGFGQGTQIQLGFLPEAQTDFIFAAIAEEGGFLAILLLVGSFGWMVIRILKIGIMIDGNIYKYICLGTAILFIVQFVFNIGSNIGLIPVIGVTLPFVSYGGSSLLANMLLIGIIQSAWIRRS